MDSLPALMCKMNRRWGVEIEINAFDGIARGQNDPPPDGIENVSLLVHQVTNESATVQGWGLNHNNDGWIVKPDGSAGIEVCSPVSKTFSDLKKICKVVEAFKDDGKIQADNRCALHVHVDISGLNAEQRMKVLAYYIKCEPVFMDSVPSSRKLNRYCQLIGATDAISHDSKMDLKELMNALGRTKYTSLNTFHWLAGKRETIEFRIAEGEGCLNAFFVKNWVRLLLHFIERVIAMPMPVPYKKGDRWSSFCWLDPKDVMKILGFNGEFELSKGLKQVRNWFLARIEKNINDGKLGVWSLGGRRLAKEQVDDIMREFDEKGESFDSAWLAPSKDLAEFSLYADEYIQ